MNELEQAIKDAEAKGFNITLLLERGDNKWTYPPLQERNYKQVFELISRQIEEI